MTWRHMVGLPLAAGSRVSRAARASGRWLWQEQEDGLVRLMRRKLGFKMSAQGRKTSYVDGG